MAYQFKIAGTPASHFGTPGVLASEFQIPPVKVHPGKQQVTAQVVVSLPLIKET